MINSLKQLEAKSIATEKELSKIKSTIYVSLGTCGLAAGGGKIKAAIQAAISNAQKQDEFNIVEVGCMGLCHSEPTIEVVNHHDKSSIVYGNLKETDAVILIATEANKVAPGLSVINRGWYYPEESDNTNGVLQSRIVLRNSGRINPEEIDQYIAKDGYKALGKALTQMEPTDVVQTIVDSGLRGRGGGGFPSGLKWQFTAKQPVDEKFVICNADEGDPGAFMDRAVLEGDPHSVLEAMTIAGYAVGASVGIIYIRAEYPQAIARLRTAIAQSEDYGFLGKNIFDSGFNYNIEIKYGAGAFVCGEETALIHSIEGGRGEPTFKPPFPAVSGLWGKPTLVNNVETYANVCAIIRQGADWFKSIGTEGSAGTKVFALAGKINKVGLVEVPMGTTLRDIIYRIGEGIQNNKQFKAVQTGGPSGGCIKSDQLDVAIDYESLKKLDSMMGSGGMIVLDEDDCMVNIAKFFLEFTLDESCGKCTPCRIGNTRLYEMLEKISEGKATMETLSDLKELCEIIKDTALCGLGQTSPNPVLSTIKQFEDEYLAHINDKKCPAGVCSQLITFKINDRCVGCTQCAKMCPVECITGTRKGMHYINQDACIKCGFCWESCKFHAIDKI